MFIHARSAVKSLQNTLITASIFTSVNNRYHWLLGAWFKSASQWL
ncbi:hypothetical protein HMPREF0020_02236 [Acinetobacter baumannii 6013113]|nr:hypothetical protein HMPREF0020_02236 [Acinetobacter baumannii 6013113]